MHATVIAAWHARVDAIRVVAVIARALINCAGIGVVAFKFAVTTLI
ncbi:MAG: hypothetical protein ACOVQN_02830 [Exiguobacterium sp.]